MPAPPLHPPTIVYVEDNDGDATLVEEALHERGHQVELLMIENGDHAMRYFRIKETARDLPPPHCVLLDSHLPAVTGVELVKFLRGSEVFRAIPIYLFGTEREYGEIASTVPVSRDSFLRKPADWAGFLALADLLMRSAAVSEAKEAGDPVHAGAQPEIAPGSVLRSLP